MAGTYYISDRGAVAEKKNCKEQLYFRGNLGSLTFLHIRYMNACQALIT